MIVLGTVPGMNTQMNCHQCGVPVPTTPAEAERVAGGGALDCDRCTDPTLIDRYVAFESEAPGGPPAPPSWLCGVQPGRPWNLTPLSPRPGMAWMSTDPEVLALFDPDGLVDPDAFVNDHLILALDSHKQMTLAMVYGPSLEPLVGLMTAARCWLDDRPKPAATPRTPRLWALVLVSKGVTAAIRPFMLDQVADAWLTHERRAQLRHGPISEAKAYRDLEKWISQYPHAAMERARLGYGLRP